MPTKVDQNEKSVEKWTIFDRKSFWIADMVRNRNGVIFGRKSIHVEKFRLDGRKKGRDQDFRTFPKYS